MRNAWRAEIAIFFYCQFVLQSSFPLEFRSYINVNKSKKKTTLMWLLGQEKIDIFSQFSTLRECDRPPDTRRGKKHCAVKFISPSAYLGHLTRG